MADEHDEDFRAPVVAVVSFVVTVVVSFVKRGQGNA